MFRRKQNKEVQLISITPRGTQYGDPPKAQGKDKPSGGSEVVWKKKARSFDDNLDINVSSHKDDHSRLPQHAHGSKGGNSEQKAVSSRLSKSLENNIDKIAPSSAQAKEKHGSQPANKPSSSKEPDKSRAGKKSSESPSSGSASKSNPKVQLKTVTPMQDEKSEIQSPVYKISNIETVTSHATVQKKDGRNSSTPKVQIIPQMELQNIKGSHDNKNRSPSPVGQEQPHVRSYTPNIQIIPMMEPKKSVERKISAPGGMQQKTSPSPRSRSPNLRIIPMMEPNRRTSDSTSPVDAHSSSSSSSSASAKRKEYRHSTGAILDSSWTTAITKDHESHDKHPEQDPFRDRTDTTESKVVNLSFDL